MDWLVLKEFTMHSGGQGHFKIECDGLTDGEVATFAYLIADRCSPFDYVAGIPRGGVRIANALDQYRRAEVPGQKLRLLIVDDVWTTGGSMRTERDMWLKYDVWKPEQLVGAVMFARSPVDDWVCPIFQMA